MAEVDDAARAALRARQGAGARYDAQDAPHDDLLLARRGTAYLARRINELTDADLALPSLRGDWSRRRLVAHAGHHARALAIALKSLREPLIPEEVAWQPDLALAETLPPRALRHLFEHARKHLDVEWRDLPGDCWDACLQAPDGAKIIARDTPRLRAIEVWQVAIDLGNRGRPSDVPSGIPLP